MSQNSKLFTSASVGGMSLPHRVVLAPMTRARSSQPGDIPNAMNATYYAQRSSAAFIISEASQISPQGKGYSFTPGIYTEEQVAGWRLITDAVHKEGGRIYVQLWHVGRMSHPEFHQGELPVAPSAVPFDASIWKVNAETGVGEMVACVTPRALETAEIKGIVDDYRRAARNAMEAGFDGVEIHGANGYLIDQFLRDGSNRRDDAYGGSIENRARFALEVVDAVVAEIGAGRVGIRLSPVTPSNDIQDSNPQAIFGYLVEHLNARGIAFIHFVEGETGGPRDVSGFDFAWARKTFKGTYIANNGYTRQMALDAVDSGAADAVAFGRAYIANPDLVQRLKLDAPLNEANPKTFYTPGEVGYTDYPALQQAA